MHVDLRSFLCFALCHLRITQKLGRSDALVLSTLFYACFEDKEQTEGIQKALRHVFVEDSPGSGGPTEESAVSAETHGIRLQYN